MDTFTTGGGLSRDHVNDLPRAISLSLLDSNDNIIRTELIFFTQSYDVSNICVNILAPNWHTVLTRLCTR